MKRPLLLAITFYQQALSAYLPSMCRYTPTCSQYTHQAIGRYGVIKGGWLSLKRLGRCHPFSTQGHDPIP